MGSGCGDPIAEKIPSSSGQLPVPVALHARSPTLFPSIIHDWKKNVKPFFAIFYGRERAYQTVRPRIYFASFKRSPVREELYTYTV